MKEEYEALSIVSHCSKVYNPSGPWLRSNRVQTGGREMGRTNFKRLENEPSQGTARLDSFVTAEGQMCWV